MVGNVVNTFMSAGPSPRRLSRVARPGAEGQSALLTIGRQDQPEAKKADSSHASASTSSWDMLSMACEARRFSVP